MPDALTRLYDQARAAALDGAAALAAHDLLAWLLAGLAFALAAGAVALALRAARRRAPPPADLAGRSLAKVTRGPRLVSWLTVAAFFGGFGLWSATAPLTSAAVAQGVVKPDGQRKTVQHLEGGIIKAIHVREGQRVAAGDRLVTLEDVQAQSALNVARERLVHLLANEARLAAEHAGEDSVSFPPHLRDMGGSAEEAMDGQRRLFASRRDTLAGRLRVLDAKAAQLEEENAGLRRVIAAERRQLDLIGSDIATVGDLVDRGLARKPRLLELRREEAEIEASLANNEARVARNAQAIGEARFERLNLIAEREETVNKDLAEVRAELARVRSELPSRSDMMKRTVITAPVAGTVLNLRPTTEHGVLGPGDPILDIVPADSALIIDARVKPTDIELIRPGQTARVLLTAFGQRDLPQITGELRTISADRLVDERQGEAYFLAQVEVSQAALARVEGGLELSPGMPAEVMIITGRRTLLDYLIRPFIESITKAFQEA